MESEIKQVAPDGTHTTATVQVFEETKRKKKKRRYTSGLGTVQNLERGLTRSLDTVSEGIARVFSEYTKRSKKSSFKKRDGALRDGLENWTRALSKGMRVAGKAPYQFVKEVNSGKSSKRFRDTLRSLTPPPLR